MTDVKRRVAELEKRKGSESGGFEVLAIPMGTSLADEERMIAEANERVGADGLLYVIRRRREPEGGSGGQATGNQN